MREYKIDQPDEWRCPQCGDQVSDEHEAHIALFKERDQVDIKCASCMEDLVVESSGETVEFVESWNYV